MTFESRGLMMHRIVVLLSALTLLLTSVPAPSVAAATYGIYEELPVPAGADGAVIADVNQSRVYVGHHWSGDREKPYAINDGDIVELTTDGQPQGNASAINDRGLIVGWVGRVGYGLPYRWTLDGVATSMPDLGNGGWATDVAEDGTSVGGLHRTDGGLAAVKWSSSGTDFETLWEGWAEGISDDGTTVWGPRSDGAGHVVYKDGRLQNLPPGHEIVDVNAAGQWALKTSAGGAVQHLDGTIEQLQAPQGFGENARAHASDIGDDGQVVGHIDNYAAVVWETPSQPTLLPVNTIPDPGPGAEPSYADFFGPSGEIVGHVAHWIPVNGGYAARGGNPVVWNHDGGGGPVPEMELTIRTLARESIIDSDVGSDVTIRLYVHVELPNGNDAVGATVMVGGKSAGRTGADGSVEFDLVVDPEWWDAYEGSVEVTANLDPWSGSTEAEVMNLYPADYYCTYEGFPRGNSAAGFYLSFLMPSASPLKGKAVEIVEQARDVADVALTAKEFFDELNLGKKDVRTTVRGYTASGGVYEDVYMLEVTIEAVDAPIKTEYWLTSHDEQLIDLEPKSLFAKLARNCLARELS